MLRSRVSDMTVKTVIDLDEAKKKKVLEDFSSVIEESRKELA